jgi:phosphohistidine phosphatase
MKTLTLIRHAKSSWLDMSIDDFDRPLNKRGEKDGPFMNKWLKKHAIQPELILCSPANRARLTLDAFSYLSNHAKETMLIDDIYESSMMTLISVIQDIPDSIDHAALIGHNPGLSDLAHYLSRDDFERLVTSAVMILELDISHWNDIAPHCGSILTHVWPKLLKK